jgi:hypothetical protein
MGRQTKVTSCLPSNPVSLTYFLACRALLHKFFFPQDYEEQPIHHPTEKKPRQYASFNINVTFNRDTQFRIPFRELSKDMADLEKGQPERQRQAAWVEFKMSNASTFHYVLPMVVTRPQGGYIIAMDLALNGCTVNTSLTNSPFLTCSSLTVWNCIVQY